MISRRNTLYLMAAAAGVLLGLAFPLASIAGFAWVAPGLLLFTAGAAEDWKRVFRTAYAGGFAYYLVSLYWLLHIPVTILPIFGWIGLSAYLALYTGGWAWACWRCAPADRANILECPWWRRQLWALECAAFYVAAEMVIGRFLSGFPWDFLGVSQYRLVPLIQVAEYTGVYGVSFLVIWFSVALTVTGLGLFRSPQARHRWAREIALPGLALLVLGLIGYQKVRVFERPNDTVRIAMVQPSIPQTLIWDETENDNRFEQLIKLSEEALATRPDILLWPEASVPRMVRYDRDTREAVRDLAMRYQSWIILGSDDAEQRGQTLRDIFYYNSAFAISPEGELKGMYRKRRLVIFGEYMPFVKWLPFLRKLSPAGESGFTPGEKPVPFQLESLGVRASVLICFEDTFPHIAREYVEGTTDFLVNLTNNGWFGESAAQWQHAATAVFRAVENRIPLVRCANNGLTCWVDANGYMHEVYFPDSRDIYQAGYKVATVPVLSPGETRKLTFYTRYGDVFGWTCFAVTVAHVAAVQWRRSARRTASTGPAGAQQNV